MFERLQQNSWRDPKEVITIIITTAEEAVMEITELRDEER